MPHLFHVARSTSAMRGLAVFGIATALAAGAVVVFAPSSPSSPSSSSSLSAAPSPTNERRVAIRVDCKSEAACARAEELALDVWSEERGPGMPLDVVVSASTLEQLATAGATWSVIDQDIDASARTEALRLQQASALDEAGRDWFAEYRDYNAITTHFRGLAEKAPERVSLHTIGSSLDGRPLFAARITNPNPDVETTPMLINGTQHAREWISAMVTTCVADRLVNEYESNAAIRAFVDSTELWIVPVVNPDGYQYSWGQDRYWRKNRRDSHGVDLNRNFSVAWGGTGSSGFKRSQTYRGTRPFSENESVALRDLAKREEIKLHIDFHAYGQLVLYPWNHSDKPTDDDARYAALGDRLASAIYAQHGTQYRLMRGVELYASAGTMSDWMYGEAGAVSFTIELRPRGGNGFVLPPDQIRPTCDEGLAALLALRKPLP